MHYFKSFVILILSVVALNTNAQSAGEQSLNLLFVGDIMGHGPQIQSAYNSVTKSYDYTPCFKYVKPIIQKADLAIGNLEVTLPGKPPYKGYPMFRSPDALGDAVKDAGFDLIVTANNHSNDGGLTGINHTIDVLRNLHLHQTGTFKNEAEKSVFYPLIVYKNGFKLAFLNYTYDTNGLPTPAPAVVNGIDEVQIKKDITAAKALKPDGIIVVMHWGLEYQLNENEVQQKLAGQMFDWGADLIVGAHPHVVQPIKEVVGKNGKKQVIAYSLGNFISNQQQKNTDGGIIFEIELKKEEGKTGIELGDYSFIPVWRYIEQKEGKKTFYALPIAAVEGEDNPLGLSESNRKKMKDYAATTRKHLGKYDGEEHKISWESISKTEEKSKIGAAMPATGVLPLGYAMEARMGGAAIATKGGDAVVAYYIPAPVHGDYVEMVAKVDTSIKGKIEILYRYEPVQGQEKGVQPNVPASYNKPVDKQQVPKEYTFQSKSIQSKTMPPAQQPAQQPTQQPAQQPTSGKQYTIQFQASRNLYPKSSMPFANVDVEDTGNGWYRYYTGTAYTLDDAKLMLQQVQAAGFPDAFITKKKNLEDITQDPTSQTKGIGIDSKMYKIQFQSARNYYNIDPKIFTDVTVIQADSGWFKYYTGTAYSLSDADKLLKAAQAKGFKDAFIVTFDGGKPAQ